MHVKLVIAPLIVALLQNPVLAGSVPTYIPINALEADVARSDVVAVVEVQSFDRFKLFGNGITRDMSWPDPVPVFYHDMTAKVVEVLKGGLPAAQGDDGKLPAAQPVSPRVGNTIRILEVYNAGILTVPAGGPPVTTQPADPAILRHLRSWPHVGQEQQAVKGRQIVFLKRQEGTEIFGLYRAWPASKELEASLRQAVAPITWPWGAEKDGLQIALLAQPRRPTDPAEYSSFAVAIRNVTTRPLDLYVSIYLEPTEAGQNSDSTTTGKQSTRLPLAGMSGVIPPGGLTFTAMSTVRSPPGQRRLRAILESPVPKVNGQPVWQGKVPSGTIEIGLPLPR